jgi:hypothetical protein
MKKILFGGGFAVLVVASCWTLLTPQSAYAATIHVTTTVDENTQPSAGLGCGLYEAIQASNTDSSYGGCAAGSGADIINIPTGTYNLVGGSTSRFIDITEQVTIEGDASTRPLIQTNHSQAGVYLRVTVPNVTIRSINLDNTRLSTAWNDGGLATNFTVEQVDATYNANISSNASGTTLRDINISDSTGIDMFGNNALVERTTGDNDTYIEFGGNGQIARDIILTNSSAFMSDKTGGSADNLFEDISVDGSGWTGIFISAHGGGERGKTIVRRATATNNRDDGIGLYGVNGGGNLQLIIEDSYIASNGNGGTFSTMPDMTDSSTPSLIVRNTLYENNHENGGIFHSDGYAQIERTTFFNNDSWSAGAVYASGRIDIENSTLFGNSVVGANPGEPAYGGAIFFDHDYYNSTTSSPQSSTLTNVTIVGNTNPSQASAINIDDYDDDASTRLTTALPLLRNTLIANNTGDIACRAANYDPWNPSGLVFAANFDAGSTNNISSDGSCTDFTQQSSLELNLDTQLRDMGGSARIGYQSAEGYVPVLPLLAGSTAINAGTNAHCPATDQRGQNRPLDGICDVGAYEGLLSSNSQAPSDSKKTAIPLAPDAGLAGNRVASEWEYLYAMLFVASLFSIGLYVTHRLGAR